MPNITINIKNCGCGGGTKTVDDTPFVGGGATGEWGDPTSPSGPPEGYFVPTSGLQDRQCKAAVWLYDWLRYSLDVMGNTTEGAAVVSILRGIGVIPGGEWVRRALIVIIPTIFGLLAGPDPSDIAIAFLSYSISGSIASLLASVPVSLITQPLFQDALDKITPQQDEIICQLSKASDAFTAFQDFQKAIQGLDLTFEQKQIILAFAPRAVFNLLFFTSDYWPSFDDDYLSGITTTCCGGYLNDQPITAGSQEHCQASWFIIDKLAASFMAVYDTGGAWSNFNPFDDDRPDIYAWLQVNLATPNKVKERAYNYTTYLNSITEITYHKFFLLYHIASLTEFYDLAAYITANDTTLVAALQAATTPAEAYTALQPLRDWINDINNVDDTVIRDYMLQALDALIQVDPDGNGLLDLLFLTDSDLANYALGKCVSGTGEGYVVAIDNVIEAPPYGTITDENNLIGADDDLDCEYKDAGDNTDMFIDTDLGQVFNNAIQLTLRVRSEHLASEGRRPYRCYFNVKENVGDPWQVVGHISFGGTDLDDMQHHYKTVTFSPRNIRYVQLQINRGINAFGKYARMYFDSLKVVTE